MLTTSLALYRNLECIRDHDESTIRLIRLRRNQGPGDAGGKNAAVQADGGAKQRTDLERSAIQSYFFIPESC